MDDECEQQPLLPASSGYATNNANNEDSISSTTSFISRNPSIPIYGTSLQPAGRIISPDERVTYTWNEINAFGSIVSSSKSWFSRRKDESSRSPQQKHILKNVSGVAYPGEVLAVLGSSGAGKTTLLNALTFRTPPNSTVTGVRCVNGVPVSLNTLASQSAYVQQNDLFIGNLTVKEHLVFQALVRMDRDMSYSRRMQRVEEVITELSLTKCQNTQIGIIGRITGISGGEKKRLAFAAEVLTNPKLMFCDEPTSGLDSFMALNVVQVLKGMAMTGKTVVCTVHQPSSELYALFDKVLLMSEGRTAFLGTPEEADAFFRELEAPCPKNYNPADYFIQILAIVPEKEESSRAAVSLICDRFDRSAVGVAVALEAGRVETEGYYNDIWFNGDSSRSPYKATWWTQFRAVLWRSWLTVMKEPMLINVRFLQTIVIGLLIGLLYYGQSLNQEGVMNINGVLFVYLTNLTFQNVFAVVNVFCAELQIFLREHRSGMYRTDVYFLCKTLAEAPIFITIPVLLISVSYFLIGLNTEGSRFFVASGVLILVANVAVSFGYFISCISTSISMALSIAPSLIVPALLFGGFFLNVSCHGGMLISGLLAGCLFEVRFFSSIPAFFQWLSYLSWFRFGNGALLVNQWSNVTNIQCPPETSACPEDGHVVLEIYNFSEGQFNFDIIMLALLIVGFRLAAYLALLLKTYQRSYF